MKSFDDSGFYRSHLARWSTLSRVCVWALAISGFSMFAQAQEQQVNRPDSSETPWNVLSAAMYVPDTSFNGGLYRTDLATSASTSSLGKKIVHLNNGDVIVAGLAPSFDLGSVGAPINLGLARYNSAGQRLAWTNPGPYVFNDNFWLIYPNTDNPDNTASVKDVLDIKVFGNRIFVLMDHRYSGNDTDSFIAVFGLDGTFLASTDVLETALDEYSGGMVIYGSGTVPDTVSIAVTASTFNGVWRPTFIKGTVNSDSSITFSAPVFPNPGNYCPTNRGCILRSIATGSFIGPSSTFYLAGTRQATIPDHHNWDFLIMAVNLDGSPVMSFGGSGVTTVAFDDGVNNYDDAKSIAVYTSDLPAAHDEIYVSGFVDRICKEGFGVAKLTDTGLPDYTFGTFSYLHGHSGQLIIGGNNPSSGGNCTAQSTVSATYVNDMTLAYGKLAVAGFTVNNPYLCATGGPCREDNVDGAIAVIDTEHGDIDSFRTYRYTDTVNGSPKRHSGFWGITESGNGTFTATGDVRYFQSAPGQPPGGQQFGTLRVVIDTIFANGFE